MILFSNPDKRDAILQVWAQNLKSLEGKSALFLRELTCAGSRGQRHTQSHHKHAVLSLRRGTSIVRERGSPLLLDPNNLGVVNNIAHQRPEHLTSFVGEKRPNFIGTTGQVSLEITMKIWCNLALKPTVYRALLPDERPEHKADYVPSFHGAARGKDFATATTYVESRQGLKKWGEGRGSGLKSRITGKI